MDEIIEYLEKKIKACDEIGGMQLEKFAFVVTLKKVRKIAINYTPCCMGKAEQLPKNNCTLNRQTCGKGSDCKYPHCHI